MMIIKMFKSLIYIIYIIFFSLKKESCYYFFVIDFKTFFLRFLTIFILPIRHKKTLDLKPDLLRCQIFNYKTFQTQNLITFSSFLQTIKFFFFFNKKFIVAYKIEALVLTMLEILKK